MYFISGRIIFLTIISLLFVTVSSLSESPALILTPLIRQNNLTQARLASAVDPKYFLNITSYSAFLTVDERYNSNLFFWYFPVSKERESKEKTPWIIWLQGGPGATSMVGLFAEMGPFYFDGELKWRQYSWCNEFSMVFIDNPVGAGFSFTDSEDGFARNMEMYADNLYSAVKQLVQIYPELSEGPLYIAGESYAGRYVPALAMNILEGRDKTNVSINLKGLIMGNPVIDRSSIVDYARVFYNWGLVDAQGALAAKSLQEEYQQAISRGDSTEVAEVRDKLLDKLQNIAYKFPLYNAINSNELSNFSPFLSRNEVRKSLHVGSIPFTFSNRTANHKLLPDYNSAVSPKIEVLLEHYRILIYCGQLDLTAPCVLNAEARRNKWRWSGRDKFLDAPRLPWWFNDNVAGYIKSGGNLTELQVNGAGHMVPVDKAKEATHIVYNFIWAQNFTTPPNYSTEEYPKYREYFDLRTEVMASNSSGLKNGLIASVVLNVLLLVGIVIGGVMTMRWKRENDYFNLPLSDDILTFA